MKRVLIGLLGTIGSGKSTASNYIVRKHGFKRIIMGNLVRAVTRKAGLETTRKNLQNMQAKYRKKYGDDYFINIAVKKVKNAKKGLIDGIRTPIDAGVAKKNGAKLILIDADAKVRFERMRKRKRRGFSRIFKDFKKEESREFKMLDLKKTLKLAKYKIMNNLTEAEFYKNIDKTLKQLTK